MHATQLRDAERLLGKIERRRQAELEKRQQTTQARWEASLTAASMLAPSDVQDDSVLRKAKALLDAEKEPLTGCVGRPGSIERGVSPNPFASVSPLARALPTPPEPPRGSELLVWNGISAEDLLEALSAPADPQTQAEAPGGWKKQLIALGAHLETLRGSLPVAASGGVALDQVAVQGALAVLRVLCR